jgi:hypothetical protein
VMDGIQSIVWVFLTKIQVVISQRCKNIDEFQICLDF